MNSSGARFNRRLALLVLASFIVFAVAVVLRVGIGATPYETTDRLGRPMGFNDTLHPEHYLIIARHFSLREFLRLEYAYAWLLLAAHLLGAWLLLASHPASVMLCRWYFLAQAALFPFWIVALPLLPFLLKDFLTGQMDREGFVDIPFILATAQPVWVVVSLTFAFKLRGAGLGLFRV